MFVSIKIMMFWVVLLNSFGSGCGRFGRKSFLLLQSQSSIWNVQAGGSSETFGNKLHTWHTIPEDHALDNNCCEDLKSYEVYFCLALLSQILLWTGNSYKER